MASFLGVSVSAIKKRLFDTRNILRESLMEEDVMKTTEIIKSLFQNKISNDFFQKLMKNPKMVNLKGERLELTCLLSDLQNFTKVLEANPPAVSVAILNEYFDAMSKIVIKHEGMIDKLVLVQKIKIKLIFPECRLKRYEQNN